MDLKQLQAETYDKWADDYDRTIWVRWIDSWVNGFGSEVPLQSSIIDVGCGTGNVMRRLAERTPTLLAGIDISAQMIAVGEKKLKGLPVDLRVGDAESGLPWPDCFFDVAVLTSTIHHFPNPDRVLANVHRVLKPNAILIIADPFFPFPLLQTINLFLKVYPMNGDLHFYSLRGLRRLVSKCGFERIRQNSAGFSAKYTLAYKAGITQEAAT